MKELLIKPAQRQHSGQIHQFICELARYEKAEHEVVASVADIERSLFGEDATAKGLIAFNGERPIGFAVYFYNYSTWLGRNGLYLEDLYVTPDSRGSGAGKALLKHLAQLALEKGCGRFEWSVLDWNTPAIDFYESIGAKCQSEWLGYRLAGEDLQRFANS